MKASLDVDRLDANIRRFQAIATGAGVALRAHVKAHRCPEIARRQVTSGAVGVALHSAREAERYLEQGITDIVVAWPWRDPWRAERFAALAERCRVVVHIDQAELVSAFAGTNVGIRIDVDTGLHRVGVPPDEVVPLARRIDLTDGPWLDGVTGYRGVESAADVDVRDEIGRRNAELLVDVANAVRADGIDCPTVCAGGTATVVGALQVDGVTEICCGIYPTFDAGSASIGLCEPTDVAVWLAPDTNEEELSGCDQPWTPGVVTATVDGRLLPAHVCPLATKVDGYRVGAEHWPACVLPDRR